MNVELSKSELALIVHALYNLSEINFVKESIELANRLNDIKNDDKPKLHHKEVLEHLKAPKMGNLEHIKTLINAEDENTNKSIIIEECSELIKAVTKDIRHKEGARGMVIEEMADVLIILQMCMDIYKIKQDELDKEYNRKMVRNLKRIPENGKSDNSTIKFKDIDPNKTDYYGKIVIDFQNHEHLKPALEHTLKNIINNAVLGKAIIISKNICDINLHQLSELIEKYQKEIVNNYLYLKVYK